jgi:type I restriction enzyme S subunit
MGSEWQNFSIEEIAERMFSGPFGSNVRKAEYVGSGVPVIRGLNLSGTRFDDQDYVFVSKEKAESLSSSLVLPKDVVFVARGTVGLVGLVPETYKYYLLSPNLVGLRTARNMADPLYVFYYFRSRYGQNEINSYVSTTGVPKIARALESMRNFKILLPPISEQRAIAQILGSLDDKIELNRKMNQTLEAIARAIFKSWFIDFDPVIDNALRAGNPIPDSMAKRAEIRRQILDQNQPSSSSPISQREKGRNYQGGFNFSGLGEGLGEVSIDEIYGLFPDSFQDSKLGPIPMGWEVKEIGEAVKCVGGSTPSTKNPTFWNSGKHPFVTPKDMSSLKSPVILDTSRHITDAGVNKISSGILPIGTVILSSRAPIGYLAITEVPVSVNQGIIAMICNKDLPNYFVLYWTELNIEIIKSNAGGTTFAEISKQNFRPILVVVPSKLVLNAFVQQLEPLHKQIILNLQESTSLSSLRDTFLPKLISGELRIQDAEKLLKEAGV